jgi:hypothetical protein
MQASKQPCVGIDKDIEAGISAAGCLIRDAWALGTVPETETCAGWNMPAIEELWNETHADWQKYGQQINQLPEH